jgi:cellulose biosynthesis protein BcsQ
MAKRIALFNHKGGVSKTTTTFHLGWMLAELGKRVLMVDADPQCNLTGLLLGFKGPSELEKFYKANPGRNIKAALEPAFEARPQPIKAVECVEVEERPGLFLLPGHIAFAEYEVQLGIAQELTGAIQALQNLPGSLSFLLDQTAEHHKVDYVLIDMSPSLSSVNQNLFTTSDYFLVPTSPDFYSVMAIGSLASVIPRWAKWASLASELTILKNATYPFPAVTTKFLGIIVQKFRPRGGEPAKGFQHWIDELSVAVEKSLIPSLKGAGLLLDRKMYKQAGLGTGYVLANIADFNTLITRSQDTHTPVFALTKAQLKQAGIVLQGSQKAMEAFHESFRELAEKILDLTA